MNTLLWNETLPIGEIAWFIFRASADQSWMRVDIESQLLTDKYIKTIPKLLSDDWTNKYCEDLDIKDEEYKNDDFKNEYNEVFDLMQSQPDMQQPQSIAVNNNNNNMNINNNNNNNNNMNINNNNNNSTIDSDDDQHMIDVD